MKTKRRYEKPLARDLGNTLVSAQGDCVLGSAFTGGHTQDCTNGGSAANHSCVAGTGAKSTCSGGLGIV